MGAGNRCRQLTDWQHSGSAPQRIGVNVSAVQLASPGFADKVAEILQKTGLAPHRLELEVTESAVVKNLDGVAGVLHDLKDIGLSIAIDDFGTEYSSLNRLKVLPFDRIKMDMHFVHELETNEKDREIAKTIITLARNTGVKVLAEGIETPGQLRFLSQNGCDEIQGFYYYAPMTPDGFTHALQTSLPVLSL
jgi:EAL domain-containing protein (putative c-di-GMP-specific phosphodiesterase class I)